jgi:predicted metalloprotease
MRWTPGGVSDDVEDRRAEGYGGGRPGIRVGLGGLAVLIVLSLVTGRNFLTLLEPSDAPVDAPYGQTEPAPYQSTPAEDRLVQFVSFVLDDAQRTWERMLPTVGREYRHAKLVLFTDGVRSACGDAESAMGPFYCPLDEKVYIDLGFYRELKERFGAPGDFAQAYVITHEIGHHVQHILGVDVRAREAQQEHPEQANAISVRLELQADCLAGVWGHSTEQRNVLESGDADQALGAAAAIGDDRIQRGAGARVNPETWTHGSSRQRVAWFRRGFDSGRIGDCDTFRDRVPEDR